MTILQILKMKALPILANANATTAKTTGESIISAIQWMITGGGMLMAVWGIAQVVQSGRANDSQGKMEGSWLIIGGVLLMLIGGGTMLTGVFSNPPGL